MTFGKAIELAKAGSRIKREGWNGKNQYVELATNISYVNSHGETVNVEHEAIGNNALAFVGTSGVQLGWLASQADMLADDWMATSNLSAKKKAVNMTKAIEFSLQQQQGRNVLEISKNMLYDIMTLLHEIADAMED